MDLLKCHGMSFTCKIYDQPRSGRITVKYDSIYLCQNYNDGGHSCKKWGYEYAWGIADGAIKALAHNGITDLVIIDENYIPEKLIIDMRAIALAGAKKAFGNDTDNIDAFLNGWELGIEWYKQQQNPEDDY